MISCHLHDYIEIACLYRYQVRLTLSTGAIVEGTAFDTGRKSDREECIELENQGNKELIVLEQIVEMKACVDNPHFQVVPFR